MVRPAVVFAVPLLLAACGSQKTVSAENASIAEVADATKDAARLEPGKWENRVTFVSADAPGLPPQMADMMKQQMAATAEQRHVSCVTPEMADRPPGDIFMGQDNGQCRYETLEMGGGRIDAVMLCKGATGQPGEMRMTMAGSFSPRAYDMVSEIRMGLPGAAAPTNGGGMTIKTRVVGTRVGPCDGSKG